MYNEILKELVKLSNDNNKIIISIIKKLVKAKTSNYDSAICKSIENDILYIVNNIIDNLTLLTDLLK